MEYHFIITLKKIEITSPDIKEPKVLAELVYGSTTKRLANPRFIRNKIGSFYLERMVIVASNKDLQQCSKVTLKIYSMAAYAPSLIKDQKPIGEVQFDLVNLFQNIGKESTRAESHHDILDQFNIEYDLLLIIKNHLQDTYIESSQDSLSIDKSVENMGAYSTPIETPANVQSMLNSAKFEKKDSNKNTGIQIYQKRVEGVSLLDSFDKTATKGKELQKPTKPEPKENLSEENDEDGSSEKKKRITRKESGNSARANVFKSKRGQKSEEGGSSSQIPDSAQKQTPPTPAQQQQKLSSSKRNQSNIVRPEDMTSPQSPVLSRVKTPPKQALKAKFSEAAGENVIHFLKKQTILTTPGNHKVRVVVMPEGGSNKSIEKPKSQEEIRAPSPKVIDETIAQKAPLYRKLTPPPQKPQTHNFDQPRPRDASAEKLSKLTQNIEVIPEQNAKWKSRQNPVTPTSATGKQAGTENSESNTPKMPKKRSSFRFSKDNEDSLTKKSSRVSYTPDVGIQEIDSEIKKYRDYLTKRDIKMNILLGFLALVAGYFIGNL